MRTGLTISGAAHVGVLLWSVLTFAAQPFNVPPIDALPVDIISATEFTQMTAGAKNAPQSNTPKPVAEKVADATPAEDPLAKLDKKEVKAATDVPPTPPEPKPAPKKQAEQKADPIADAIKKDDTKKPELKKAETKTPTPPKKPAPPAPAFDPRQMQALLDKRDPTRVASAAESLNSTASLGTAHGQAAQLSQSEIDALRRRITECWNPPVGAENADKLRVVLRVLFNQDGTVSRPPDLVAGTVSPLGPVMAESAKRAILRCQPFTMLKPEHYEQWKDIEITFDPREMLRG
jgi:outer membrane biosynthesis protein TonB